MRRLSLLALAACASAPATPISAPLIEAPPIDFDAAELHAHLEADAVSALVAGARLDVDLAGCDATHVAWRGGTWFDEVQHALDAVGSGDVVLLCPGVRAGALRTTPGDVVTLAPAGEPLSAALDGDGRPVLQSACAFLGLVELDVMAGDDGGVTIQDADRAVVVGSRFHDAERGALTSDAEEVVVVDSVFEDNRRQDYASGGAVRASGARLALLGNSFLRNFAGDGGAASLITSDAYPDAVRYVLTSKNRFEENEARVYGGAIAIRAALVRSRKDTFVRNHAIAGGALEVEIDVLPIETAAHVELRGTTFEGNGASKRGSAARFVLDSTADLVLHEVTVVDSTGPGSTLWFQAPQDLTDPDAINPVGDVALSGGTYARNEPPLTLDLLGPFLVGAERVDFGVDAEANSGVDVTSCDGGLGNDATFVVARDGRTVCP